MAGAADISSIVADVDYMNPLRKTAPDARGWGIVGQAPILGSLGERLDAMKPVPVQVHDARPLLERNELSLDTTGFILIRHSTQVANFADDEEIKRVYFPEVIDVIKQLTGAEHAVVVIQATRTDVEGWGARFEKDGSQYARFAHLDANDDFHMDSANRFVKFAKRPREKGGLGASPISPEEAVEDFDYMTYNLWRPFDRAVEQNPLCLLDARTLEESEDLCPLLTPLTKIFGGNNGLLPNPRHRWWYFPKMQPEEMLIFMGQKHPIDRRKDAPPGSSALSPHTSFVDPTLPATALGRRSHEVRVLAAFRKKKNQTTHWQAKL